MEDGRWKMEDGRWKMEDDDDDHHQCGPGIVRTVDDTRAVLRWYRESLESRTSHGLFDIADATVHDIGRTADGYLCFVRVPCCKFYRDREASEVLAMESSLAGLAAARREAARISREDSHALRRCKPLVSSSIDAVVGFMTMPVQDVADNIASLSAV